MHYNKAMRVLSRDLKDHIGKNALVRGWLHKKRAMGGLTFLVLRDRAGIIQIVVQDGNETEKLRGLQVGTVLEIKGDVKEEPRAKGGAELHNPKIEVLVPVDSEPLIEIDKAIDHTPDNLDTLFEHRAINLRNIDEQKIFCIRAELNRYIREFLVANEFIEIQTPKIIAGATEGGAEVFKLKYYDQEATLAQSPQLYKQMMVGVFERVFEIGPAFRAEPSLTTRHMSEVTMLDIEMGFIEGHDDVLKMTEKLLFEVLTKLHQEHPEELGSLKAPELKLKPEFPRYTVAQVHELYTEATGQDTSKEKDLIPAEERWICDYAVKEEGCEAVFVTEFPVESMKFYHMVNPDNPATVLWADLLFRGLEIATVPQREHRYEKLVEQMKTAGIDPEHPGFKYYLQAFQFGLPPHGGFGFGIDRLVQKVVGLNNIKEATLFPRDMQRLTP
jgi:nondiscriminating aspartyl-tRNA synthetase